MAFDQQEYMRKQNEREAANRVGKPLEVVTPVVAPVIEADDDDEEEPQPGARHDPGRSQRRRERGLLERAAKAEGRAELLQELIDRGMTPGAAAATVDAAAGKPAEDPEPQRKDFPDDAAHNRALGRWDARQETKAELAKRDQAADNAGQLDQLRADIAEADTKYTEDKKLISDYDEVAQKALKDPEQPTFEAKDQPYLLRRIATSDVRAFLLHHFATNPADFKKALDLMDPNDLTRQANFISRLEGKVEKMYSTEKPANGTDGKKTETAADRDARKPKPSEAGSPKGGSAPVVTISPYLSDGRTLNPAWKAQQNEREGLRR